MGDKMINFICTLKDITEIDKFAKLGVFGLIINDPKYSTYVPKYNDIDLINETIEIVHDHNMKLFVRVDAIFYDGELAELALYLKKLIDLKVDGIYFADMAVYQLVKKNEALDKLIYDPETTITNSFDLNSYLQLGVNRCVIAKELTYKKILQLIQSNPTGTEMIGFGYLRMSRSRRLMLSGYQKAFLDENLHDRLDIQAQEASRNERFYINEDDHGTYTYSPYLFWCIDELKQLKDYLSTMRIERSFIDDELYFLMIDIYQLATRGEDVSMLIETVKDLYPHIIFSTGFLYEKTTL